MANDVPPAVLEYLSAAKTVTLATASSDGAPHASTFMFVNDGLTIYIWGRPSSQTSQNVAANPRVSFAIDEYVNDWNKAKGIQGDGECRPVGPGDGMAKAVGMFAEKFPSPSSGASTTNIAFYEIVPTSLQFIDNEGAVTSLSGDEFGMNFNREQVLSD